MHRKPLLKLLERYSDRYAEEQAVIERIRSLIEGHPDCFERTCRPGHVTGSAWVLSHDRQSCLLVHHRKLNRWLQPGGHADGDGDVAAVARREAEEETGLMELELVQSPGGLIPLDLDVHLIPERRDAKGRLVEDQHEHHDVRFLLVAAPGQTPVRSDESNDVRWFSHDALLRATDEESVLRMLRKAGPLAGQI